MSLLVRRFLQVLVLAMHAQKTIHVDYLFIKEVVSISWCSRIFQSC